MHQICYRGNQCQLSPLASVSIIYLDFITKKCNHISYKALTSTSLVNRISSETNF